MRFKKIYYNRQSSDAPRCSSVSTDGPPPIINSSSRSMMHFLRLPAEIRVIIYHHLFANLRVVLRGARNKRRDNPSNIALVCRLCYLESLPIFYNCVTIGLIRGRRRFLRHKIGAQSFSTIRSIAIPSRGGVLIDYLREQPPISLKTLHLECAGRVECGRPKAEEPNDEEIRECLYKKWWYLAVPRVPNLWQLLAKYPTLNLYLDCWISFSPMLHVSSVSLPPNSVNMC